MSVLAVRTSEWYVLNATTRYFLGYFEAIQGSHLDPGLGPISSRIPGSRPVESLFSNHFQGYRSLFNSVRFQALGRLRWPSQKRPVFPLYIAAYWPSR